VDDVLGGDAAEGAEGGQILTAERGRREAENAENAEKEAEGLRVFCGGVKEGF
jgi:hypothetical protein